MLRSIALLALGLSVAIATNVGAQTPPQHCHADLTDETLNYVLRRAKQISTDSAPVYQQVRDSIWKIPRLAASDIAVVSDEQVCQQALAAYDADVPPDGVARQRRLYVIRLGADYLAVDSTQKFGQWLTGIVLSPAFVRKSWGRFGV
jgi:hypothetical protein